MGRRVRCRREIRSEHKILLEESGQKANILVTKANTDIYKQSPVLFHTAACFGFILVRLPQRPLLRRSYR
jgi:hypothetical protein